MKKIIYSFLLFPLLLSLQGCNNNSSLSKQNNTEVNIQSTNLSDIKIDNIVIGEPVKEINFGDYTTEEKHSGNYKYLFNEIVIGEDEKNTVNYVAGKFNKDDTVISINDNKDLNTIEDITKVLGSNYTEHWENKDQGLKNRSYYDTMRNIKSEFIYSFYDDSLSWIKISRLK